MWYTVTTLNIKGANTAGECGEKKFKVMVTERYFITKIHEVSATSADEAKEIAEDRGCSGKDFNKNLEYEECESYIL